MKNDLKKLKIYIAALGICGGIALSSPASVMALDIDEEILFVDTDDDYVLEDIPVIETQVPSSEEVVPNTEIVETVVPNTEVIEEKTEVVEESTQDVPTIEEVLDQYIEKKKYGEDEFIDGDNWSLEQDIEENPGAIIPTYIETEAERKEIEVEKETEKETETETETEKETETETENEKEEEKKNDKNKIPKTGNDTLKYLLSGVSASLAALYFLLVIIDRVKNLVAEVNENNSIKVVSSKKKFAKISELVKKLK